MRQLLVNTIGNRISSYTCISVYKSNSTYSQHSRLKHMVVYRNGNLVMLKICNPFAAPEVVKWTTSDAASEWRNFNYSEAWDIRVGVNSIISTQLQLQLQRFQLQPQFQLRPIARISTPTPTPGVSTPTPTPANLQNINWSWTQLQLQLQLRSWPRPCETSARCRANRSVKQSRRHLFMASERATVDIYGQKFNWSW